MKTPALLFSVPLLVAVLSSQAAAQSTSAPGPDSSTVRRKVSTGIDLSIPQEKGTDGSLFEKRYLRVRGQQRLLEVMTDRVMVRSRDGKQRLHRFSGSKGLMSAAGEATRMQKLAKGNRADLVAYPADRPRTEDNKFLLTPKVRVSLMEGSDPKSFYQSSGAIQGKVPAFAPRTIILTYSTVVEAMVAVENLNATPGVLSATQIIAVNRNPEYLPAEQYFSPSGPGYNPSVLTDNVITPDMLALTTSAYAWWANNRTLSIPPIGPWWHFYLQRPVNSVPSKVGLGDFPPIAYNPDYPLIQGELADVRVALAWENKVNSERVGGYNQKILIIDDGVRRSHPDLATALGVAQAVDLFDKHHYNFFRAPSVQNWGNPNSTNTGTAANSPDPMDASDAHGTGMAGLIAARRHSNEFISNGQGIVGVAPRSTIQSVLAAKGFVDDDYWAQAFAYGTTLVDKDSDGFLYDETIGGMVDFDIAVNASSESGSQVASTLFPEDYLWHMAIKFGATTQRSRRGVIYVTSAGNGAGGGGPGHMDVNYSEQKNYIYQIAVGGISDLGRPIGRSNPGAALVCVAPTWGDELPPLFTWTSRPGGFPTNRPFLKNPPVGPDDLPVGFRRTSQGIMTLGYAGYTADFTGTSASAAQVAGVVALMLEVNPQLGYRDVKEILLRSCRVTSDVRVASTTPGSLANLRLHPTQWRMGPLGRPLHHKMGAGLIDANKAVKLARNWTVLPATAPEIQPVDFDPDTPNVDKNVTRRDRFTGGIYIGLPNSQLIPEGTAEDKWLKIGFSPTLTGRMEQIEVRLRLLHGRRGDLEVKLVAPQTLNWDTGLPERMESILMEPHRDDYVNCSETNPMDWTFTTVRHWGTKGGTSFGLWELWIRDSVSRGQTLNPTIDDPVYVPRANAVGGKMIGYGIRVHQSSSLDAQDPPVVSTKRLSIPPQSTPQVITLKTEPLPVGPTGLPFPVTNWDFYHSSEICPVQMSNPTMEPFEFFPPGRRLPEDTSVTPVLVPLETATVENPNALAEWPQRPLPPAWVSFYDPPPPFLPPPPPTPTTEGAYGALGCRPPWVTDDMLTPFRNHLILRDAGNPNPLTNFIHVRLNRKRGTMEVIPLNVGSYKIKVYAENLLGLSKPQEIDIRVERPGYGLWRDTFWPPPDNSDPAISGYFADPDGDGVLNVLEYTLGLNPTVADPAPIPPWTVEGNEIVFRWQHDISKADVAQLAQISPDLETWTNVTPVQTGVTGNIEDLEYRLPLTPDVRHFFRLKAVPPP